MSKCTHTIKQRDVAAIRECTLCLQAKVKRLKKQSVSCPFCCKGFKVNWAEEEILKEGK